MTDRKMYRKRVYVYVCNLKEDWGWESGWLCEMEKERERETEREREIKKRKRERERDRK